MIKKHNSNGFTHDYTYIYMSCTSCDYVHFITCTKYYLKMALTCTIYENNFNLKIKNYFKSEVMKSNDENQKKHNIQHA